MAGRPCRRRSPPTRSISRRIFRPSACSPAARATGTGRLFDLNAMSATDLDMRLSAARVTIGSSKLGRTAFGANLRGGALALSVGEAQVYGGIARGSFGIARSHTGADGKAQI